MNNRTCSINFPAETTPPELAHLAQQGHLGAFAALFDLHKATVYSLCLQTTNNVPDAEQLTQDIFLNAFRNLATCPDGVDFSVCVHNAAVSRLKMHERMMHLSACSLDRLVALAAKPIGSPSVPERFAHIRVRMRDARANFLNQSWVPLWTRFARPRQTAKAIS